MAGYRDGETDERGAHMFHAGLALELSRIIWDDRRADATAGRGPSGRTRLRRFGSGRTSRWMSLERAPGRLIGELSI